MILKQSIDSIAKLKVSFSTWSVHETLSKLDPEVLRYGEDCVVVSPDSVREAGGLTLCVSLVKEKLKTLSQHYNLEVSS